jgi:4-diphosphocytidyl-2-C-methyl-D-erythritol kinase
LVPETADNLVLRAAELLRQTCGFGGGARITLVKRIPPAAGLGGGSSDAAATLAVLNRAWNLQLDEAVLLDLASRLGSDVPFFMANHAYALCTGRGEQMEPIDAPAGLWLVLARPPAGLSTPAVYRGCVADPEGRTAAPLIAALQQGDAVATACHLRNGLQASAERLSADVVRLKDEFARLPVCGHQLTGSGSAWFGICRHRRHAAWCAARLQARGVAAVWTVATCC